MARFNGMRMRIKICGITNLEDALAAVDAGAHALGFMFYDASPRFVTQRAAADIIRALPPFVAKVGVFVNPSRESVVQTIAECGLDTLQFHGDEAPEFCLGFGLKTIKAFRIRGAESLQALAAFPTDAWLLDSFVAGQLGGTGAQFNWAWAAEAARAAPRRIILAGGLTPENVARAVQQVEPYALDVSSGVESKPGKKDAQKMQRFIAAARLRDPRTAIEPQRSRDTENE